jgi:multidrug transporter EmrE-like cation transporter
MAWLMVVVAGLFETGFAVFLKLARVAVSLSGGIYAAPNRCSSAAARRSAISAMMARKALSVSG